MARAEPQHTALGTSSVPLAGPGAIEVAGTAVGRDTGAESSPGSGMAAIPALQTPRALT